MVVWNESGVIFICVNSRPENLVQDEMITENNYQTKKCAFHTMNPFALLPFVLYSRPSFHCLWQPAIFLIKRVTGENTKPVTFQIEI